MSFDSEFLSAFGFDSFFSEQQSGQELGEFKIARIIHEEKNLYRLQCSHDELRWGEISGKFYFGVQSALDLPAVGDWVAYAPLIGSDRAQIHRLFNRKTCLYRSAVGGGGLKEQILGANIDEAWIMTSLNLDLSVNRLERYFVLCRDSGVRITLVLTKRDLVGEEEYSKIRDGLSFKYQDIKVVGVSVKTGVGLSELHDQIKAGQTIALLGSSGVGKSSLTNYFLGEDILVTNAVRESDDKGRHTTSGRHLFLLPSHGLLMDTPGMRELQLFQHQDGLSEEFEDIEKLVLTCRFSNCRHDNEPGCAILKALAEETLAMSRWNNYAKLQKELSFQARKLDKALQSAEKQKWKKISHEQRRAYKR